eukprot:g1924.t1
MPAFAIAFVPADSSQPVTEWNVDIPPGQEVECLVKRLKRHFARFEAKDAQRHRAAFEQQLRQHMGKGQMLTEDTLTQLMSVGSMVDTVPLVYNTADVGFVGVTMYVDDQGSSKELSFNARASQIARACHCPTQVLGDAFIGRFFDNEDDFARRDFRVDELRDDAPWMQEARQQAARRAARAGGGGGGSAATSEAAASAAAALGGGGGARSTASAKRGASSTRSGGAAALPAAADKLRQRGNKRFVKKDFAAAVDLYTKAITACDGAESGLHKLYSNRSAALLGDGNHADALADAARCVELEPSFAKGHFRLGRAALAAGQAAEAAAAAERGLRLEPGSSDLLSLLKEATVVGGGTGEGGGRGARCGVKGCERNERDKRGGERELKH